MKAEPCGHTAEAADRASTLLGSVDVLEFADVYRDLHQHPELSFAEHRTAGIIADRLAAAGASVTTQVGGTGVVGLLTNGDGPTVLLRTDMDGLPVSEATGLDYASRARGTRPDGAATDVMHACGHDVHMTSVLGVVDGLSRRRDLWRGTVMVVAQPAEEIGEGARAMVLDGLYRRFGFPDAALAQHVEAFGTGRVAHREGLFASGAVTLEICITGRGGHASTPEVCIDPIVVSAATILRLQSIVAREISPYDPAVVTVSTIHAGAAGNNIPNDVRMTVNVRYHHDRIRRHLLDAIHRIVKAECAASGCPDEPTIDEVAPFPLVLNDEPLSGAIRDVHRSLFGDDKLHLRPPSMGSEDFSVLSGPDLVGRRIPSCYWEIGGAHDSTWASTATPDASFEERITRLPGLHSDAFQADPVETARTGILAMSGAYFAASSAVTGPRTEERS
jgi:amidohydrolase